MLVSILIHAQLPCIDSISFKIQHLPEPEKIQIQNLCNWVENNPESSTRSAPDSPIIGLIENSDAAACQEVGTSGTSKEPAPGAEKGSLFDEQLPPSAPASDAATTAAGGTGSGEARGSSKSSVRVVPFQSLPDSAQEELGKELFDDPLLTVENVKKLADYMQWSFKFTKVSFCLPGLAHYRVVYDT